MRAYSELLQIHPFTDGNGRLARAVLDQMLRECLSRSLPDSFTLAQAEHQAALLDANRGDLTALKELLINALS